MSPIALVVHAKRAHLGTATLSPGTTLYENDTLSTEADGQLVMRSADAMVQVETQTSVILRSIGPTEKNVSVELLQGTLVLSSTRATAVEVRAEEAAIRPVADVSTIAHVRVAGPRELRIFARRATVEFSYGGERALIREGLCYRVVLDSGEVNRLSSSDANEDTKRGIDAPKRFRLILIAAGVPLAIWGIIRRLQSPDRP